MIEISKQEGFTIIDETTAVGLMEEFEQLLIYQIIMNNTWEVMKTKKAHEQVIKELN